MSEENIMRVKLTADGSVVQIMPDGSTQPIQDNTDWERLRNMTEEEIEANALSDPDNPPISDEELKRFRRVPNLQQIRTGLNLTQEEFSEQFQIPLGTLRDWEQGKKMPDSAARALLRVIEKEPEAVLRALAS
ncbi:MAG TPA: helix-turn-helix domain-containing protein [Thermomicrobiales bacterium]|nr:helix-turn-helix domain-containing protein [Thermomicrobiales bacterium]